MGVAGRPFSKTQVVIGILQFFISWPVLSYLWAISWGVLALFRGLTSYQQPPPMQATQGETGKGYDVGRIGQAANPFESMGGMA